MIFSSLVYYNTVVWIFLCEELVENNFPSKNHWELYMPCFVTLYITTLFPYHKSLLFFWLLLWEPIKVSSRCLVRRETFQSVVQSTVRKLGIRRQYILYPYKCSVADLEAAILRQLMGLEYLSFSHCLQKDIFSFPSIVWTTLCWKFNHFILSKNLILSLYSNFHRMSVPWCDEEVHLIFI